MNLNIKSKLIKISFDLSLSVKRRKFSCTIDMLLMRDYKEKTKILCFIKIISYALYLQTFDYLGKPSLLNVTKAKFCLEIFNFLNFPEKSFINMIKWITKYCFTVT